MAKTINLKSAPNKVSVQEFIDSIADDQLKKDSKTLHKIFKEVTGSSAKMWGPKITGCN